MNSKATFALAFFTLIFWGCRKTEETSVFIQQDIIFSINHVDPFTFKDSEIEHECALDESGNLKTPSVAEVVINGISHFPNLYSVNGKLYTRSIRLELPGGEPSTINISRFALLESIDGQMIMATPVKGSFFSSYVSLAVDFDFEVQPLASTIIPIEVLCTISASQEILDDSYISPEVYENKLPINQYIN